MSSKITWVLVVVALLIGAYAGYYYEKQKMLKLITIQRVDMQQQIVNAKKALVQQQKH